MRTLLSIFILVISAHTSWAQNCNTDEHSSHESDSWASCELAQSPNASRGNSHWIMYDLGEVRLLGKTKFWNYNVRNLTDRGAKTVAIDYSIDGQNWTTSTQTTLQRAPGLNSYKGEYGPDLANARGQYILLTIVDNYGSNCVGLSEFSVEISPAFIAVHTVETSEAPSGAQLYPNPNNGTFTLKGVKGKKIIIMNSDGRVQHSFTASQSIVNKNLTTLVDGLYIVQIIDPKTGTSQTKKYIKE